MRPVLRLAVILLLLNALAFAQSTNATITGRVVDPNNSLVTDARVEVISLNTNVHYSGQTNREGLFTIVGVPPGPYRVEASKAGFKTVVREDVVLRVQDIVGLNFTLQVGSVSETVTVTGGAPMVDTQSAAVSTVVDQTYVANMPLNGRSFQDLILLTPGVVTQSSQPNCCTGLGMTGEFSVNGQRPESNNYTVDGVSANTGAVDDGTSMFNGAGVAGSVPAATALGTTQSLVSVDELQEFRVQTSSYSAEYGRNPGAQFAFETKSGTNQWHGTAYDYLRNDYFDANDWFSNYNLPSNPALAKHALRQNDFGGTLGGPIGIPHVYNGKDKTFVFVSYEGLRLLQPRPAKVNGVPDLCSRGLVTPGSPGVCENPDGTPYLDPNGQIRTPAPAELQPALNAFPLPNGADFPDGWAQLKTSWSDPSSIDSTSVRLDQVVKDKTRLFFRFNDTESSIRNLGGLGGFFSPSTNGIHSYTTRTYTAGATTLLTSRVSNEFRLNYTSNEAHGKAVIDSFGGSTPLDLAQATGQPPGAFVQIFTCWGNEGFCTGIVQDSVASAQKQWNLVDTASYSVGRHQLKFGADYRRLAPFAIPENPFLLYGYFSQASVQGDPSNPPSAELALELPAYPLYKNFSAFAQDEWKVSQHLNLSMGLRWDVNPAPRATKGQMPWAIQGSNPDTWAVAPQGTPLWKTTWYNFGPRLGMAYSLRDASGSQTVVRAGGGLFFDTGQQQGSVGFNGPGFLAESFGSGGFPQVPPTPVIADPTTPAGQPYQTAPWVFPTHFQEPYTLQWNASVEQALGKSQAITMSYVGSHAARLIRTNFINTPNNPNSPFWGFVLLDNGLTSDYHSSQVQFQRRLSQGLTALASYTWSHLIDWGSQNYSFGYQRGNADYDLRHNFNAAFSYDLPNAGHNGLFDALLHHWGIDDRVSIRSGFPITVNGPGYYDPVTQKLQVAEMDLVHGQPLYVYGANCNQLFQAAFLPGQGCPGGRGLNPSAFQNVPADQNGVPLRAGTAPRNYVRGFGAWQMNLGVRREFPIYERLKLQFRAEAFNVFNHPAFGTINSSWCDPSASPGCMFGLAQATLATSLGNTLSSLYQSGGPRSMQFALKAIF